MVAPPWGAQPSTMHIWVGGELRIEWGCSCSAAGFQFGRNTCFENWDNTGENNQSAALLVARLNSALLLGRPGQL
ncbi:hypothetical protein IP76_22155 [Rhizobium sp. AAP43]|nr:hypothetical protein IP76_22155 [Rhizobium sp. AAP43]